jgi:hypothetical protein
MKVTPSDIMQSVCYVSTFVNLFQTAQHYIPEDSNIFYSIFVSFIFTVCKGIVFVSVLEVSHNFYSHCTLNESAVTVTVCSVKSASF